MCYIISIRSSPSKPLSQSHVQWESSCWISEWYLAKHINSLMHLNTKIMDYTTKLLSALCITPLRDWCLKWSATSEKAVNEYICIILRYLEVEGFRFQILQTEIVIKWGKVHCAVATLVILHNPSLTLKLIDKRFVWPCSHYFTQSTGSTHVCWLTVSSFKEELCEPDCFSSVLLTLVLAICIFFFQ